MIDKIFRESKLYRPKWDEVHYTNGDTYGKHTIEVAIGGAAGGCPSGIEGKANELDDLEPYDIFGEPALTGKPEWPVGACPKGIDAFARDEAERIGVDVAMVAIPAIGMATIAISDRFKIQPKRLDSTWTEDPRLWLAVVGDPGQKKTPAINSAKRPLAKVALELHQQHCAAMKQHEDSMAQWEKNKKVGPRPIKPVEKRIYVDDTTIEALRRVLEDNHLGVGIVKDELSGWLTSLTPTEAAARAARTALTTVSYTRGARSRSTGRRRGTSSSPIGGLRSWVASSQARLGG